MKKNKGFTLVEMIVTISLLAIIGITIGVSLNKIFKTNETKNYEQYVTKVKEATILYANNHAEIINDLNDKSSFKLINIKDIIDEGFISKKLKDPTTNNVIDGNNQAKVWISEDKELVAEYPYNKTETENYLYAQTLKIKYNKTNNDLCYEGLNGPTLQLINQEGTRVKDLEINKSIKAYFEDGSVCSNLTADKVGSYKIKYVYTIDGTNISDTNENVRETTRTITVNPTKPIIKEFKVNEGDNVYKPNITFNISDESDLNPGLKYCISTSSDVSSCTKWIDVEEAGKDKTITYELNKNGNSKVNIYLFAKNVFEEYTSSEIKDYVLTFNLTIDIGEYQSSTTVYFNNNSTTINGYRVELVENHIDGNTSSSRQNNKYIIYDIPAGTELKDILSADDFKFDNKTHPFEGLYQEGDSTRTSINISTYKITSDTTLVAKWYFLLRINPNGGTFTYEGQNYTSNHDINYVPKYANVSDYITEASITPADGCKLTGFTVNGDTIDINTYQLPYNIVVKAEYQCGLTLTIDIGEYQPSTMVNFKENTTKFTDKNGIEHKVKLVENYDENNTGTKVNNKYIIYNVETGMKLEDLLLKDDFYFNNETHPFEGLYQEGDSTRTSINISTYEITAGETLVAKWYFLLRVNPNGGTFTYEGQNYTSNHDINYVPKYANVSDYVTTSSITPPSGCELSGFTVNGSSIDINTYQLPYNIVVKAEYKCGKTLTLDMGEKNANITFTGSGFTFKDNISANNGYNNRYIKTEVAKGTKISSLFKTSDFVWTDHYYAGLYDQSDSTKTLIDFDNYTITKDVVLKVKWNFQITVNPRGGEFIYNGNKYKSDYVITNVPKGSVLSDYFTYSNFYKSGYYVNHLVNGRETKYDSNGNYTNNIQPDSFIINNNVTISPEYVANPTTTTTLSSASQTSCELYGYYTYGSQISYDDARWYCNECNGRRYVSWTNSSGETVAMCACGC